MRASTLAVALTTALALAGCCSTKPENADVATAIDLCGSIGKLQAANTRYLAEVNSLAVKGKSEQVLMYPELTPQLRVSAMRSTSHCINLQLKKITSEQYDSLMAAEAAIPAMAERALTPEQLESLIAKGYQTVAAILRQARVSDQAIASVDKGTAALPGDPGEPPVDPDGGTGTMLKTISGSVSDVKTLVGKLPAEIVAELGQRQVPAPAHPAEALVTLLFAPGAATLDASSLEQLGKLAQVLGPDARLSIVGSADATGDELKNMELSRQRAQSVAIWFLSSWGIEARQIHVAARGAQKGAGQSSRQRSVTVYRY